MALEVGELAPDFELENQHRHPVRLSDFRGKRHVVLAFHPLAFTPVCANEMCGLEKDWRALQDGETHVLSISVDSTAAKAAWAKSLGGVSYDLLSDFYPHGAVAERYGVFDKAHGVAERAVFLLDKEGRIRYRRVYEVPDSIDNQELMEAVAGLR
jgi:peroxiredoxin